MQQRTQRAAQHSCGRVDRLDRAAEGALGREQRVLRVGCGADGDDGRHGARHTYTLRLGATQYDAMRRGGTAPEATIEMRERAAATASLKALGIDRVQPLPFQVPTRRQVDLRYCFVPRTVKECYLYAILNRDSDAQVAAPPVRCPLPRGLSSCMLHGGNWRMLLSAGFRLHALHCRCCSEPPRRCARPHGAGTAQLDAIGPVLSLARFASPCACC